MEFIDSASRALPGLVTNFTGKPSNDNTDEKEPLNITREEFSIFSTKMFKKLDTIIDILNKVVDAKSAAKRAAIEQDHEAMGTSARDQPRRGLFGISPLQGPGWAAVGIGLSALAGVIVGKWEDIVGFFKDFGDRIKAFFDSVKRWVENAISTITGGIGGAAQGAVQAAPALLAGPLGLPIVAAGAVSGGIRGAQEAQANQQRDVPNPQQPNTATTTTMPTPNAAIPGVAAPIGASSSLTTPGGPQRTSARDNPNANAMQNQMREFAEAPPRRWTVTSSYRTNNSRSAHDSGDAIDIRSRDTNVTDDTLRDVYNQFRTQFPGRNFDVFYEPYAVNNGEPAPHIHVQTGSQAHNRVAVLNRNGNIIRPIDVSDIERQSTARNIPAASQTNSTATRTSAPHSLANKIGIDAEATTTAIVLPGTNNTTTTGKIVDETRPTPAIKQVQLEARNPFETSAWQRVAFGT